MSMFKNVQIPMWLRLVFGFLVGAFGVDTVASQNGWAEISSGELRDMLLAGMAGLGLVLMSNGKKSANDRAVASIQDVVTKTDNAREDLTKGAEDSIKRLLDAVGEAAKLLPAPPPLPPQPNEVWQRPMNDVAQRMLGDVAGVIRGAR